MDDLLGIPGMTPGGIGIWSVFAVVFIALIRAWPLLAAQAIKAREQLRSEKRDDIDDMRERITALEGKVTEATQTAHAAELKLVSALAAYRLIASELLKVDPDNMILRQAQELLNVSYPTPRAPAPPAVADTIRDGAKT
jgi:hypothetical protein